MVYFRDSKARLTGTDALTRESIAKGVVSPTFTSSTGKQIPRGVVQLDIISGRNIEYATASNAAARLRSALGISKAPAGTQAQQIYTSQLHESPPAAIKTSTTLKASNSTTLIFVGVFAVIAYFVVKGK